MKLNRLNNNEEFKKFSKIENIQNTDFMENTIVDKNPKGLGFSSDILFNDQFTFMDLGEMTGLEVFNKVERK